MRNIVLDANEDGTRFRRAVFRRHHAGEAAIGRARSAERGKYAPCAERTSAVMGTASAEIQASQRQFIAAQRLFFIACAAPAARVNVSPKPTDALRIIDARTAAYLDLTGSGNETAALLRADGRLTFMFCAFAGPPMILRLFGRGHVTLRGEERYTRLLASHFAGDEPAGARQMVVLEVDLVRTSCGFGVPLFDYVGERDALRRWAVKKGEAGLREYRGRNNAKSIDGLETGFNE